MSKDKLRDIDILLFVDFDRHAITVIPHRDGVVFLQQAARSKVGQAFRGNYYEGIELRKDIA